MAKQSDCAKILREAAGEGMVSRQDADELVKRIAKMVVDARSKRQINLEKAAREVAEEVVFDAQYQIAKKKRAAVNNFAKFVGKMDYINQFENTADGISAAIVGTPNVKVKGSGLGTDQLSVSINNESIAALSTGLKKAGKSVERDFSGGRYGLEVYKELQAIGRKEASVTGNKSARTIAEVYHKILAKLRARANRAGASIADDPDYILMQTHDPTAIRQAGGRGHGGEHKEASYQAWKAVIEGRIDPIKTYGGRDADEFLRAVHEDFYNESHAKREVTDVDSFLPKGSLANKLSASRVLWFKDAESAFEYNQAFGIKHYNEAMMTQMKSMSRSIAVMEDWGENADIVFEKVLHQAEIDAAGKPNSREIIKKLKGAKLRGQWDIVTGRVDQSLNSSFSRTVSNIQAWLVASKLGGVLWSSIGDKMFTQSTLTYSGLGKLNAWGIQLKNTFGSNKELLQAMDVFSFGFTGNVAARHGFEGRSKNALHSLTAGMFKWTGFDWWNDSSKAAMADGLSGLFGENAKKAFDGLAREPARLLRHYNISAKEWDIMRGTVWNDGYGHNRITFDRMDALPETDFIPLLEQNKFKNTLANLRRVKDATIGKYRALVSDQTSYALNIPGAREKYVTTLGATQRGTISGELARLGMLFKSFPTTVYMKQFGREKMGHGLGGEWTTAGTMRLAQVITMAGFAGYVSLAAKDLLKGRTPRDPRNPKVWLAALQQGGGLGIYGDFLLSEYDQHYKSFLGRVAGPALGQLDPLGAAYSAAVMSPFTGEDPRLGSRAMTFAKSNLPLMNVWYVKPILDYFIFWHLDEMLSPGILERREESAREINKQDFFITPSEVVR